MKNQFVLILMLLLIKGASVSQWQPDVRLTNVPLGSVTSYTKCISSSGNDVHVTWMDLRTGNLEIFYKRSADGGTTWGSDVRLTNNPVDSDYPAISASGQLVHIVWQDRRDTNIEVYYKRSTDGGVNWGADVRLTANIYGSWNPSVASSGSDVIAAWYDSRDLNAEIYIKRSTNGGLSWSADTRITNNAASSQFPSIFMEGSLVHLAWTDNRDGNPETYYKRSSDGGVTWGADTRLSFNGSDSWYTSVSASGQNVHVVWRDDRNVTKEIYYNGSTNGGITWGGFDTRITFNSVNSEHPSVSASGSNVHLVYQNDQNTNLQIYYRKSTNAGSNWSGETRLTNTAYTSARPSAIVSGNVVHAVWHDSRNGGENIYYKRDPSGNLVGVTGNGTGIPDDFSVSQNYPNPFNPVTKVNYQLPKTEYVNITLYDQLGREILQLFAGERQAGFYELTVDGTNLASGLYFCTLKAGEHSGVIKMSLIK